MQFDANQELERLQEVQTASEDIFDGIILHVKRDTVRLPNGNAAVREVIRHIGAVCVIPVTEDRNVVVERQYRYPVDRVILEIPAGKLDAPDEDRLSAIQRELREETGYTADRWTDLGDFHPAPAYSDEYITMYLARELHKGPRALDEDEFLDVYTVPLAELVQDVMDGKISDAKTQVCILKAARILGV
jgi:ADP-ribose pyrophosphatase